MRETTHPRCDASVTPLSITHSIVHPRAMYRSRHATYKSYASLATPKQFCMAQVLLSLTHYERAIGYELFA